MILSTLAKLKAHLGIPSADTSKDAKLTMILEGASSYIEGQTSRQFELQSYTMKLSGDGSDTLVLPQYPILQDDESGELVPVITGLTLDGVNILSEIESGAIDVDAEAGILYRDSGWYAGRRNIVITYSAGYSLPDESGAETDADELPKDLELAAIRLSARVYERSTAEGTSSVSPASYSVQYAKSVDPEIVETLGRHSRVRVS